MSAPAATDRAAAAPAVRPDLAATGARAGARGPAARAAARGSRRRAAEARDAAAASFKLPTEAWSSAQGSSASRPFACGAGGAAARRDRTRHLPSKRRAREFLVWASLPPSSRLIMREFTFRSGRAEVEMPVQMKTDAESFVGTSRNIGVGGLFVSTERSFQVGDRLTIEFALPELDRLVSVGAEVRWIREAALGAGGVGLRFVRLPIVSAIAIQEYVRRQDDDLTPAP